MWKVYAHMNGQDGNPRFQGRAPTIYGPLVVKRWVRDPRDRRHRLSYKPRHAYVGNAPRDDNGKAAQAVQYAQWLAHRDGITIPSDGAPRVVYHVFPSAYERTAAGRPIILKHAMAVIWRIGSQDVAQIPIPHCGWEPAPAKEIFAEREEQREFESVFA